MAMVCLNDKSVTIVLIEHETKKSQVPTIVVFQTGPCSYLDLGS